MLNEIVPIYTEEVPELLEEGKLYISKKYAVAIHLCACGCGVKTVTPLKPSEWTLTETNGAVSLQPSIGNFKWEKPYHAHYYITNNKIIWC